MNYDFIAIPDADVPQAVESVFQHVVTTYASETNKTVSMWRAVPDDLLGQIHHQGLERLTKPLEAGIARPGHLLVRRFARRAQQHRVAGRGVAVDGDRVEGDLVALPEQRLQRGRGDRGIGEDVG